jgi:pimeloyl-ACP methyl ester carboxylesterase
MFSQIQTFSFSLSILQKGSKTSNLGIILPGRLDSKDYSHITSHQQFLADRGYLAVTFDAPGIWESQGTIEDYTTTNYLKALNEVIEHYGNRPTLLVGHSRGGAVAQLATTNPAVTAVVLLMASYEFASEPSKEDIERGYILEYRPYPPNSNQTGKKEFKLPLAYIEDGKKYLPYTVLKKFKGPKLLVAASRDEWTEPEEVVEVFEQLSEPKMYYEIDSPHDYKDNPKVMEEINQKIREFLEKFESTIR